MAASCNPFAFNALPAASATVSRLLLSLSSSIGVPLPPRKAPILSITGRRALESSSHRLRAAVDDEWGREPGDYSGLAVEEVPELGSLVDLKQRLKDLLYGLNRGLDASSEMRAKIVKLITQIEAKNHTLDPTVALPLLNGKWILAFMSFSQLFPLLGSGRMPELVKVAEILQMIDSEAFTVQNSVQFTGPLATTSVSTNAKFAVRSPKCVQIKFEQGIIGTPQLTDSLAVPDKVEFFIQSIDLSPFKGIITSIQDAASSVMRTINGQPH